MKAYTYRTVVCYCIAGTFCRMRGRIFLIFWVEYNSQNFIPWKFCISTNWSPRAFSATCQCMLHYFPHRQLPAPEGPLSFIYFLCRQWMCPDCTTWGSGKGKVCARSDLKHISRIPMTSFMLIQFCMICSVSKSCLPSKNFLHNTIWSKIWYIPSLWYHRQQQQLVHHGNS